MISWAKWRQEFNDGTAKPYASLFWSNCVEIMEKLKRDFDRSGPILAHLSEAQKKEPFFFITQKRPTLLYFLQKFSALAENPLLLPVFSNQFVTASFLTYLGTVLGAHLIPGSLWGTRHPFMRVQISESPTHNSNFSSNAHRWRLICINMAWIL